MKVLVVGAAGKTGRAVVEQAVAAGHQVTAFVHKADEYDVSNVRVIEGDATDSAAIDAAICRSRRGARYDRRQNALQGNHAGIEHR